jgi:FkbM family methyltransferase
MSLKSAVKKSVKQVLWTLHLDLTRNMKYDRYAFRVFQRVLNKESNCIDIGCHKGEILEWMLRFAPQGEHYAIEPIPFLFQGLKEKFVQPNVHLCNLALSNKAGRMNFTVVKNAPAYSGIKQRKYAVENPELEIIKVDVQQLDELIPKAKNIRLIKLDVEGAELDVLKGTTRIIKECQPYIFFEFGLGSAEYYEASPQEMFSLMEENSMQIFTLKSWLDKNAALNQQEFVNHFMSNSEYYFLAVPLVERK